MRGPDIKDRRPRRSSWTDEKFDESVRIFFRERLEFYLKDVRGYAYDVVKAVLAADADDVVDALARAEAVKQVMHMPEFQAIGAACKRMRNILRQAAEKNIDPAAKFVKLAGICRRRKELDGLSGEYRARKSKTHRRGKDYLRGSAAAVDGARTGRQIFRQSDGDGR